jgi:hypothetical protein
VAFQKRGAYSTDTLMVLTLYVFPLVYCLYAQHRLGEA